MSKILRDVCKKEIKILRDSKSSRGIVIKFFKLHTTVQDKYFLMLVNERKKR